MGSRLESDLRQRVIESAFSASLRSGEGQSHQALKDFDTVRGFVWSSVPAALLDVSLDAVIRPGHVRRSMLCLGWWRSGVRSRFSSWPWCTTWQRAPSSRRRAVTPVTQPSSWSGAFATSRRSKPWGCAPTSRPAGSASATRRSDCRQRPPTELVMFAGVTKSIRFLLQAVLLGSGAVLVIKNEITPGAIVAASMLMSRALAPVEMTIGAWRQCVGVRDRLHAAERTSRAVTLEAAANLTARAAGDAAGRGCRCLARWEAGAHAASRNVQA